MVFGGAKGLEDSQKARLAELFTSAVAPAAAEAGALAVAAVAVVIVGGWLTLVSIFDKPPTHFKDTAPWSTTLTSPQLAAERNAPPSKANAHQGASSRGPSNVAGLSDAK